MRALTLWQPWATLIAAGIKTIETRSWSTGYRGPLAIHAAKRPMDRLDVVEITDELVVEAGLDPVDAEILMREAAEQRGCVVAVATLTECLPALRALYLRDDQYPWGHFSAARFGWVLDDVRRVDPVPARGKQGLWEWP